MTLHQAEAFLIVLAMLNLFAEQAAAVILIAALAHFTAVPLRVVSLRRTPCSFANPVIVIIDPRCS